MGVSAAIPALIAALAGAGSSEESRKSASKQASKGRRLSILAMANQPESVTNVRGSGENAKRQQGIVSGRNKTARAGIANALNRRGLTNKLGGMNA